MNPTMYSIKDLLDAHGLIVAAQKEVCNGPDFPWKVLCHAEKHINKLLMAQFVEEAQ